MAEKEALYKGTVFSVCSFLPPETESKGLGTWALSPALFKVRGQLLSSDSDLAPKEEENPTQPALSGPCACGRQGVELGKALD